MKQLRKLFEANFKSTFREKQVWFWSIFYPVLLLVVFLMIFGGLGKGDSNFEAKVTAVVGKESALSESLLTALKQIPVLEWKEERPATRDEAEDWVKKKDVDALIVIPDEPDKPIELVLNKEKENSTMSQALSGIMGGVLQQANYNIAGVKPQLTFQPIYVSSGSDKLKYIDFLLTGLMAMSISQGGLFGMVGMVEMRRNGLLKRLLLSPMSTKAFGLADMLVRAVLAVIQLVLLTMIGVFAFGASLDINFASLIIVLAIGIVSFSAIGFLIAALSKTMESYFGIANLLSFVMMFLSGIFFEMSMLPAFIKPVSVVLPLTYFAEGIRDSMVYGLAPTGGSFWLNIGVMAAWGAVAFAIGSRFFKWKA
ncbi:ABC transporter permease [Paenibacillus contaminans]|uniref:ABC transporter permease n=1 Tax=Paenibacillus contaminans TaxID=450362 RepID=UPI001314C8B8|nr:ABC transporter permease [Paenibacillus contaminans]